MKKINVNLFVDDLIKNRESDDVEFKSAAGGFPGSIWETYSSFANTDGGVIVLGVKEKNGSFYVDGLTDEQIEKYKKDFWSGINNRGIVNVSLLKSEDVEILDYNGCKLLVINVPRAERDMRPVYQGLDPYEGTFKRNFEGDYKCSRREVQRMFSDANLLYSSDQRILDNYSFEDDIDKESLLQYRQLFSISKPDHAWSALNDMDFLRRLGAYRKDRKTGKEGFTVAGILMFGKYQSITDPECLPSYFPDYREIDDSMGARWSNRIYPDGNWEPNLFQFYRRTLPVIQSYLPKPFVLKDNLRIDESPAHIALREAFINLCVHADYTAETSLIITYSQGKFEFSNPGTLLVSRRQFFEGGISQCRNLAIQTMFMMLGPADKAGSGGDKIMEGWRKNGWVSPMLVENSQPDRVVISLSMHSLIQDDIREELHSRYGDLMKKCDNDMYLVAALALTEREISNERLRQSLSMHKADITEMLKRMCRLGILTSIGYGRGTVYKLADIKVGTSGLKGGNFDQKVGTSASKGVDFGQKVSTSDPKGGDFGLKRWGLRSKGGNFGLKRCRLLSKGVGFDPKVETSKKRYTFLELSDLIVAYCSEWRTIEEISTYVGRQKRYLVDKIIPTLLKDGLIEREFPDVVHHPHPRYKATTYKKDKTV